MSKGQTVTTEEITHNNTTSFDKFLTFKLGVESFGIAVIRIREIIQNQKITSVPQMPPYVKGVINLRGKVIPVIDMRVKFGLGCDETTDRTCIIVVQVESREKGATLVGLIVDAVEEVANIADEQIEDKPDLGGQVDNQYILGIAKIDNAVKTLLDIDRIVLEDNLSF